MVMPHEAQTHPSHTYCLHKAKISDSVPPWTYAGLKTPLSFWSQEDLSDPVVPLNPVEGSAHVILAMLQMSQTPNRSNE